MPFSTLAYRHPRSPVTCRSDFASVPETEYVGCYRESALPSICEEVSHRDKAITESKTESQSLHQQTNCEFKEILTANQVARKNPQTVSQILGGGKQEIPKASQQPHFDSVKNELCDEEGKHLIHEGYGILNILQLVGTENSNCKCDQNGHEAVFVTYHSRDQLRVFRNILCQFDGSFVDFILNLNCISKNLIDETLAIPFTPRQKSLALFSLFTPGIATPTIDKRDLRSFSCFMALKPKGRIYPTCPAVECSHLASKSSFAVRKPISSIPLPLVKKERTISAVGQQLSDNPPNTCSASFGERSHSSKEGRKDVPNDSSRNDRHTGQKPSPDQSVHDSFYPNRKGRSEEQDQSGNDYSHHKNPFKHPSCDSQVGTGIRSRTPETSEFNGVSSSPNLTAGRFPDKQYDPGGILSLAKDPEGTAASSSSSNPKGGADSGYSSRPPSKLLESLSTKIVTCLPDTDLLCIPCEATQQYEDYPMEASDEFESTPFNSISHVSGQAIHIEEDSFVSSFSASVEFAVPTFQLDSNDTFADPQIIYVPVGSLLPPTMQLFLYPYP